ncbi:MAG: alpha/beta hydrolase [Parcubacteria group bacterium]
MPQQILVIHGGDSFDTYEDYLNFLKSYEITPDKFDKHVKGGKRWKDGLQEKLGDKFDVLLPLMPCANNARYVEWKIWLEKFFPFLKGEVILIGHSLGGLFLAKYLSENDFPVSIKTVFLLAAPMMEGNFKLPESLEKIEQQTKKIYLYHSENDPVVPFADVEKYAAKLPSAEKVIFEDKGHFIDEEFPEFVEKLKNLK